MSTQQKILTKLIILLLCIICTNIAYAQTLLYKESTSEKDFIREIAIRKLENGYLVKTTTVNKDEMTYNTDASFSVLKWKYYNHENGTDISAERLENEIYITGQLNNKKYEKKLKIENLPWYQEWGLGLKSFIVSDKNSTSFLSLSQNNLKIYKFEAKRDKIEIINVNGKESESVYVKITFTGWMKIFGHQDKWFRKSDGTYIYGKEGGLTEPPTTIQLIEEK